MSAGTPPHGYWTEVYMPGRPSKSKMTPEMDGLNAKLNASETMLRGRIGDVKVNKLIKQFWAAGMKDPKLFKALYAKRDPYRWLAQYWAPMHKRTQKGLKVLRSVIEQPTTH